MIAQARAQQRTALDEQAGKLLLAAYGVAVPKTLTVKNADKVDAAFSQLRAPVVVGWVLMGFPLTHKLLGDMRALSDMHVNILSASVTTSRDRIALSRFTFEMADPKHMGSVIKAVRNVEGVYDAYRV